MLINKQQDSQLYRSLNIALYKQIKESVICGCRQAGKMEKKVIGLKLLTPFTQDTHPTLIILVYLDGEVTPKGKVDQALSSMLEQAMSRSTLITQSLGQKQKKSLISKLVVS